MTANKVVGQGPSSLQSQSILIRGCSNKGYYSKRSPAELLYPVKGMQPESEAPESLPAALFFDSVCQNTSIPPNICLPNRNPRVSAHTSAFPISNRKTLGTLMGSDVVGSPASQNFVMVSMYIVDSARGPPCLSSVTKTGV